MSIIYLDNSATTALSDEVIAKIDETMESFGNPSSLHSLGVSAEDVIRTARTNVLNALGQRVAKPHNLIFTSGGTEANNTAIFGTAYSKPCYRGKRIVTTASEHPSVGECMKRLEKDGFEVIRLSAKNGVIDRDEFASSINRDTFLVSIMTVNNETGAIYDVGELFGIAKAIDPNIITHTDAVQAFGKLKLNPTRMKADLISISGHKVHAPKGVGALYISEEMKKTKRIIPWVCGGGQESGFRSGTENTLGIAALGVAALHTPALDMTKATRERIISALPEEIRVNAPAKGYDGILSVTLPDIKSETMLHFLSSRGIFVSSGSACSSNASHGGKNYVLTDFGMTEHEADCTLRLSFDDRTALSDGDLDTINRAFCDALDTLVRIH